jgi:uncharacterized protein (TIGR02246 family)
MKIKLVFFAFLALVAVSALAQTDKLREAMEADNARWLAAFNTQNPAAFPAMYTQDAILLPSGKQPVTGPEAIKQFWEGNIKSGVRDHTFEIISLREDGKYAYQVARWTVNFVKEGGEKIPFSGNTVRIFERQAGGKWLTKVHIFNMQQ